MLNLHVFSRHYSAKCICRLRVQRTYTLLYRTQKVYGYEAMCGADVHITSVYIYMLCYEYLYYDDDDANRRYEKRKNEEPINFNEL